MSQLCVGLFMQTKQRVDAARQREVERATFLALAIAVTTAIHQWPYGSDTAPPTRIPGADAFGAVEFIVEPQPFIF